MNNHRLPTPLQAGLEAGTTVIVQSSQRQAAVRAAWAAQQRAAGRRLWNSPRVFTFAQFAQQLLAEQWSRATLPDRLLPAGAEWACVRELRREAGGVAEARALLKSVRTLHDWKITSSARELGASPESGLLQDTLQALQQMHDREKRRPLRGWLAELSAPAQPVLVVGASNLPAAQREILHRFGADVAVGEPRAGSVAIATAQDDDHELELIATWCRRQLDEDPTRRLLIVDSRLRQKRWLYERMLSQTLSPSQWLTAAPRDVSAVFSIEGGRALTEFPVLVAALLSLRLLTGRLRFDEVLHWLRLPFLDGEDLMAGAAIEATLRSGRRLEYSAAELASVLEQGGSGAAAAAAAARLHLAMNLLSGGRRSPAEWAPRILSALRRLGWPGARTLRSDEQQAVNRWHALLDEYSALGPWLERSDAAEAVSTLAELAAERIFDAASAEAPVTLSESHEDPTVHYDGIWVAGLDAAQWPPPPRPDVFIPLRLQVLAGIPGASAAGQTRAARNSLAAWRAATGQLICSWARLEGDAHRSASPLLLRLPQHVEYSPAALSAPLAVSLRQRELEPLEDFQGVAVDTRSPVPGGVQTLALQAECGFRAYAEMRLGAEELETPAPGIDPRERGMLLHKALELVWLKLDEHFTLVGTDAQVWIPTVADSVAAAVVFVYRGHVPVEIRAAVERETLRLERLILSLLEREKLRAPFTIEMLEARRRVNIGGGEFELRIDRIDSLEGGGYAILDYKSGEPRTLRWQGERVRDPQLLAYLLAERGRDVQALANVCLSNGRAKFMGRSSRKGLLPDVGGLPGMNPAKVPAELINAAWQAETQRWMQAVHQLASEYIGGLAPVEPASDVCRNCHLTVLCRRLELSNIAAATGDDALD